jgi:hypothetical protein
MEFDEFMEKFSEAVGSKDREFIRQVYSGFDIKAEMPEEQFFKMIFQMLEPLAGRKPDDTEKFDDFYIAHFKEGDGQLNMTFLKRGESFVMYNDKANYGEFQKAYAIGYSVTGDARLKVLFNGKRFPILRDMGESGFASMINSALVPGENEITLMPAESGPVKATIKISSAMKDGVIDTTQGDVLVWEGEVKEPVKLRFRAE